MCIKIISIQHQTFKDFNQLQFPSRTRNNRNPWFKLKISVLFLTLTILFFLKRAPFRNCDMSWSKPEARFAHNTGWLCGTNSKSTWPVYRRHIDNHDDVSNVYRRHTIRNYAHDARKGDSRTRLFLQSSSASLSITCSPVFKPRATIRLRVT